MEERDPIRDRMRLTCSNTFYSFVSDTDHPWLVMEHVERCSTWTFMGVYRGVAHMCAKLLEKRREDITVAIDGGLAERRAVVENIPPELALLGCTHSVMKQTARQLQVWDGKGALTVTVVGLGPILAGAPPAPCAPVLVVVALTRFDVAQRGLHALVRHWLSAPDLHPALRARLRTARGEGPDGVFFRLICGDAHYTDIGEPLRCNWIEPKVVRESTLLSERALD